MAYRRTLFKDEAMTSAASNNKGFTLIEMLTVIAIIAILAGLLFPAISGARRKAQIAQAESEIKSIESALKAYYTEYGRWPIGNGGGGDFSYGKFETGGPSGCCENYYLMDALRGIPDTYGAPCGSNYQGQNNPRNIVFLEIAASSMDSYGNYVDPWKHPYQITLDTDYDGNCDSLGCGGAYPTTATNGTVKNHTVVVWSVGPDGVGGTADDITSW